MKSIEQQREEQRKKGSCSAIAPVACIKRLRGNKILYLTKKQNRIKNINEYKEPVIYNGYNTNK